MVLHRLSIHRLDEDPYRHLGAASVLLEAVDGAIVWDQDGYTCVDAVSLYFSIYSNVHVESLEMIHESVTWLGVSPQYLPYDGLEVVGELGVLCEVVF